MMLKLMKASTTNLRLMIRPKWLGSMKLQVITGTNSLSKEDGGTKVAQMMKRLRLGIKLEWEGEDRLLVTGKSDLLQQEKVLRSRQSLDRHSEERKLTADRKMVLKPLAKHCSGPGFEGRLTKLLTDAGLEGIVSVGFSPDKFPHDERRGVTGFVVFQTKEQLESACDDDVRASYAVLNTEFQLGHRVPVSEKADPERNLALDRMREDQLALESGADSAAGKAAGSKAGSSTGKGAWAAGSKAGLTIRNEQGRKLDKGGEAVITGRLMEQAKIQMTELLGKQVVDLFAGLNTKFAKEQAVAAAEMKRMQRENEELKAKMVEIEVARLAQDARLTAVLEDINGLFQRLGGAVQAGQAGLQMTPVEGQAVGSGTVTAGAQPPMSIAKPQPQGPSAREQALGAALALLVRDGENSGSSAVSDYLASQGYEVASLINNQECGQHSDAK